MTHGFAMLHRSGDETRMHRYRANMALRSTTHLSAVGMAAIERTLSPSGSLCLSDSSGRLPFGKGDMSWESGCINCIISLTLH